MSTEDLALQSMIERARHRLLVRAWYERHRAAFKRIMEHVDGGGWR